MEPSLPEELIVAAANAIKLLTEAAGEPHRSDEERLKFLKAVLELGIAIDPDVRKLLQSGLPTAINVWREADSRGWDEYVSRLSFEQADELQRLLRESGEAPPDDPNATP